MAPKLTPTVRAKNLKSKGSSRCNLENPLNYSKKVCIGRWVDKRHEENVSAPYKLSYLSTTREDFGPKPSSKVDPAVRWDRKLAAEMSNFIPPVLSTDPVPHLYDNFSSTYDLAFNHFPKCYKYHIPKNGYDYLRSYGNITKYGLTEWKEYEWACGVEDPRRNLLTQYNDTFEPPEKNDYKFKRFGIPRANSTKIGGPNFLNPVIKLRNLPLCVSPDTNLVIPPRTERRDPWCL